MIILGVLVFFTFQQMKPEELTAFALAGNMQVNKFRKKQENDGRFRSKA